MNNGNPPDLVGFCEIESEKLPETCAKEFALATMRLLSS